MHLLLLVWKNSRFYNTPPRLVVIMQEICNQIIALGCNYVDGATIFAQIEAEEAGKAVQMLKVMLRVCGRFKSTYFNYKAKANSECPSNPWRIQNNALFVRMDAFLERAHDILDLTQTIVQFSKLSKIEIGGTKGKTLTTSVAQIFVDFVAAVEAFKGVQYDIMDVDAKSFDDDFYEFRCRIKELERRLASVLTQGFDDCATITGKFKLLDSFEGLLERPIIHDELEKKHLTLISAYGADLHAMQQLFLENRDTPPIGCNSPPCAGALNWCRGLLERIKQPMEKLRQLNRAVLDREEAKEVVKTYTSLVASLGEFEHIKIEQWGEEIEEASQAKLRLPLLRRDDDAAGHSLLRVNFDPKLVELLREVKYFLLLGLSVPASALTVYKKAEVFRRQTGNLDLIVNMYNGVQTTLLPVERPLLKAHLDKIDKGLKQGLKSINWKSHGIDFFVTDCMTGVKDCSGLLSMMKENLSTVEALLEDWASTPLFERRHKPVTVSELQEVLKLRRTARYAAISEGGKSIHKLLKEINKKLRVSQGLPDWKAYVDFFNNIVVAGLADVVTVSLTFLNQQFDPEVIVKEDKMPLLEIELELYDKDVAFVPNVGEGTKGKEGIRDIVDGWINSFYHVGTLFKRLDGNDGSYMKELQEHPSIQMYLATINENLMQNEAKCAELRSTYVHYEYLWTTDLNKLFNEFLLSVHEDIINEDGDKTGRTQLSLGLFDERIVHFREIQSEVSELRHSADIDFLRVNSQPIKQALSTWVTKWVYIYTNHLQEHVTGKLNGLHEFMERINTGLEAPVPAGDAEALSRTMTHIRDVRKAMDAMLEGFSPLRDTVLLLKTHGIDMSTVRIHGENSVDYLETAPMRWDNTVNTTFKTKEQIQPLQNAQADHTKKEIAAFAQRVRKFRKEFRDKAPFAFKGPVSEAYTIIDEYEVLMREVETEAKYFREQEELFELAASKYEALRDSREEIVRLKMLWDMSSLIDNIFDTWRQELWADIRTDDILDETTKIQNQVKGMPREVKGFDVYKTLQGRINNMATVIPLVHELHSPALQDRHWKTLMVVTHKHFERTASFCLDDVLQLELHMHVDDVSELVEVANKELKIENKMQGIEKVWANMMLEFLQYNDSEVKILRAPEELMEALEEHQLQLQTMIGMGRFVDYFRERVLYWQSTLGNVETTLKLWLAVQKQWSSLESIFMSSADIRAQLPEDTKRFEGIDSEFKELMREAQFTPSAVECCTREGREEVLRAMMGALEKCQKALNEYLDTKKNIFPRFYFVSNTALLDILSNGNNPPKIMPHVGDCFDSICDLNFVTPDEDEKKGGEDGEGAAKKTVIARTVSSMKAKDGEIVDFMGEHEITGAVERWLGDIVLLMQDTLKAVLDRSLDAAANWEVDNPRHKWVFQFPAQIVLLAAQIFWTEETEAALEEIEGGDEEAMKKSAVIVIDRLNNLIKLVQGHLERPERNKIIALITMDVHQRDVMHELVDLKVMSTGDFKWQSQLKFYYKEDSRDVRINITDWKTLYSYEYLGNTGRLVITPLTDRCYITLTMALRLMLGGAPAGPAGTGKTETTKDLARALGLPCYVFNCSDQMNFESMGDIFRGLSQTGGWGCFDEFNRIPIEVLSVVATQVQDVLNAVRLYSNPLNREEQYQHLPAGQPPGIVGTFEFMGSRIYLVPTTGFFITMNPGYAGRTELPENLKAHFRSCAMIRPDLEPICENFLMAEGFIAAKPLSVKFVTLYSLASELLSQQIHYDWGLRAVKSVLRVAGNLKRAEPDVGEDAILMRALRDFNTPKMPLPDIPIFYRLVCDLFPGLDLPTKVDEHLRETAVKVSKEAGLQPEDVFVSKVIQFQELLDVRHSVMLLGYPGSGKTTIWKTLMGCHNHGLAKPICVGEQVNPKSVTSDELYGFLNLAKDWKDGVLSIIMRNMSKNWAPYVEAQTMKWVVLDGDIDAVWIESMNTVMDDNKVLTLVSNERIPLTDAMRMVFEIASLDNASPATVSRAGILYINESDVGWRPVMESWVQHRADEMERATLPALFEKYVDPVLVMMRQRKMSPVVPITTIASVMTVCNILEGLLDDVKVRTKPGIENLFVFALIWAFGGALGEEKTANFRVMFSKAFKDDFKEVAFPDRGTVFDYFFAFDTSDDGKITHWEERVETYVPVGDTPFHAIVVPTVDSTRLTFLMNLLSLRGKGVCMVGGAGTGKTTLVRDYFRNLDEDFMTCTINMNYYTDSFTIQKQLETPIDKRSGKIYGPPSQKKLIYFVDDLNMPFVEEYGTQTPIALLRQHADYGCWFDRGELGLKKDIQDIQFIAAMNPQCGSFNINPRLQRHYATFACLMPGAEDLKTIYGAILDSHLGAFDNKVQKVAQHLVNAAIELHKAVSEKFLPSAVKFTYNFNVRDMASVFQGVCLSRPDYYMQPIKMIRLWMHESGHVFSDRLTEPSENKRFNEMLVEVCKKNFEDFDQDELQARPLTFTSFASSIIGDDGRAPYLPVKTLDDLRACLDQKLVEYNEANPIMELVLFEAAMDHVCRITRIIENPRGNALLVGLGGSGKQSLSRLASSICGYKVNMLAVSSTFGIGDLKEFLKTLYMRSAVKPAVPLAFMLTDAQIVDEKFLVYVNDLLSSGYIPDLFAKDEYDAIFSSLRNEAKAAGVPDTADHMMEFFIDRVRQNLHVILCFSPAGDTFRMRSKKFPGLVNCTSIDWFHQWPKEALVSVAARFLKKIPNMEQAVKDNISHHMAEVHLSVTTYSETFRQVQRRFNYVTPKSFLELISFYQSLLAEKVEASTNAITRLDTGLTTLQKTASDVASLKEDLSVKMVQVEEKKAATEALLEQMGKERGEAEQQQALAAEEQTKAEAAGSEAAAIENEASEELKEAKPAMEQANEAVNCLSKASLTELKSFSKPPPGVDKVTTAVLIMLKGEKKNFSWENAKKMMAKVDAFKTSLESYRGEDIPEDVVKRVAPVMADPEFNVATMKKKSDAAANLCSWVINIVTFNRIYLKVKPLMERLAVAQATKAEAQAKLDAVNAIVAEVEARLAKLQSQFLAATTEKARVEAEAAACNNRLSLANRLVNGLASENERWTREVAALRERSTMVPGDVLLSAAFVSYIGAFNSTLRNSLWKEVWLSDIISREILISDGIDPLEVLTNDSKSAEWQNQGLGADRISIENGAIITQCARWPLIIDPQLQGIKWLRTREAAAAEGKDGKELVVVQLTQQSWMTKITMAIQTGNTIIIENIGEDIEPVLDPVLSRAVFRKGKNLFIDIGGEEVEYDPNFKLFLQTKLANPHYKPEVAAQCTLINFIVTEQGLEDQLLARVVNREEPDLEAQSRDLLQKFNDYKIQLLELENQLLERLANAPEDILSDVPLIEGLEATKATSMEIEAAVVMGQATKKTIDNARSLYRPVATEASMLYFLLIQLCNMDNMYQYSLDSFIIFFFKSMELALAGDAPAEKKAGGGDDDDDGMPPMDAGMGGGDLDGDDGGAGGVGTVARRVANLRTSLRITIFQWVSRGLFERHVLIFLATMVFELCRRGIIGDDCGFSAHHYNFLLRGAAGAVSDDDNNIEWLSDIAWNAVGALGDVEGFGQFPQDLVDSAPRFKEWYNLLAPEKEKLPLDWRELDKTPFLKLLAVRSLRPDRMQSAITNFVMAVMPDGPKFVECDAQSNSYQVLEASFDDSTPVTPIYFILSPGVDVVADVDKLARKIGMEVGVNYHNISLGQGQDVVAMARLEAGHQEGHWVILNNVHLMPRWLRELEKKLDEFAIAGSHEKFRVFLSSDPSKDIPIGVLDRCIKLTNEPPSGVKANLKRAFCSFSAEEINDMDSKSRGILFGLCHFHAVMLERRTFGPKGYNMMYPFGILDLRYSAVVLKNYMENAAAKIPWEDLRYLFGNIMYGGHIVDDWDRTMCLTYLDYFMKDELLDEMELFPYMDDDSKLSFKAPAMTTYDKYLSHIDNEMKGDTPLAFGLHPNAEIDFRTSESNDMFRIMLELSAGSGSSEGGGQTMQHAAEGMLQDVLETYRDLRFDMIEIIANCDDDPGPFQNVFIQECERMDGLIEEMVRSLLELELGFAGDLTMSESMEKLMRELFMEQVPAQWAKLAFPSQRPLGGWLHSLAERINQLQDWVANPIETPRVTWLSGLFNPQSFLTAIMQVTAQKGGLELDKLMVMTDVLKRKLEEVDQPSRDGALVHGLFMEGARWDIQGGSIETSKPKEMVSIMPVINCKAILTEKALTANVYNCPVYKTQLRGPTFVCTATLRTKAPSAKWTLAGVVLVMDIV